MAQRTRDLLGKPALIKKARSTHPIGLARGVLSLAGLCLGIVSLGKKNGPQTGSRAASPIQPKSGPSASVDGPFEDILETKPADTSTPDSIAEVTGQVDLAVVESHASSDS